MPEFIIDVSVIIATYNVERYIERAVSSVLAQEGVTFEIIIVDDGSSDTTWQIVSAMTDPRIQCIKLASNQGPSVARNTGITRAKGAWIAVLDGDDAFEPGRLARCIGRAKSSKADIIVDNIIVYRETDAEKYRMFPQSSFSKRITLSLADFIDGNKSFFANGYTLGYLKPLFSTAFLRSKNLAYDPDIRIGEDYMLLCELLASGAICLVEQSAGYIYTARTGSISHRLSLADIERIAAGDKKFTSRYTLDPEAANAQKKRERSLQEIYGFTMLVDALKRKNISGVLKIITAYPTVVRHLWEPLYVRINKLINILAPDKRQST